MSLEIIINELRIQTREREAFFCFIGTIPISTTLTLPNLLNVILGAINVFLTQFKVRQHHHHPSTHQHSA